jgi:hypothetical protein
MKPLAKDFGHSINDQIRVGNYGGPAPNAYYPQGERNLPLGKLSESRIPSYLDIPAQRNADIPGPGSYEIVGDVPLPEGGRFNEAPPLRHPDPREFSPEPATYDPVPVSNHSKLTKFTSTAAREAEHIAEAERAAKKTPGPGAYQDVKSYGSKYHKPFLPNGGRTLDAAPNSSYFDDVAKSRAHQLGPKYDVTRDFINEPQGKPVYRYQSETLAETKKMVKQALGAEAPGPGAYDLPAVKPPPGAVPFEGLSRDNPYALPPPFEYGGTKDYTRRYYVPLLKSGSADAIYGRFDSKGGKSPANPSESFTVKRSRPAKSREELENAREERYYREEQKRRYRKGLHSNLKHAATTYKDFSGRKHQATEQLMPMAARRHVEVGTDSTDDEWMSFELHRAKLDAAADVLEANIHDLLEPLDTTRLLNRAHGVLQKKVSARMKREGIPVAKRDFVATELVGVLEDTFHSQPDLRSPSAVAEAEAAMKPISPAKSASPVPSPQATATQGFSPPQAGDTFELSKGSTTALVGANATALEGANASPTFATLDAAVSPGSGTALLSGASPVSEDGASPPKPDVSSIELGNTTGGNDMARPADITFGDTLVSPTKGEVTRDGDLSFSEEESGVQKSFLAADEDQDGLITRAEATAALAAYGQGGEDASFRLLDTDQDGKINMIEFKTLVMSGIQKRVNEFEMTAEGFMTLSDLKKVSSILGSPAVDDDAARALPADSDGRVNYFEYCRAAQKPSDASAISPTGAKRISKEYTSVLLKDALDPA